MGSSGYVAHNPWTFKNVSTDPHFNKLIDAIQGNYLFARKFAKKCDLSPLKKYVTFFQ